MCSRRYNKQHGSIDSDYGSGGAHKSSLLLHITVNKLQYPNTDVVICHNIPGSLYLR